MAKYIIDNINFSSPANTAQGYVIKRIGELNHLVIEDDETLNKLPLHIERILEEAKRENRRCKEMQVSKWTNPVDGDLNFSINTCGKYSGYVASIRVTKIRGSWTPDKN